MENNNLKKYIEIYSAVPYSSEETSIEDWFHVGRNEKSEHIEYILDIESLFSPDIANEQTEFPYAHLDSWFKEIRLHYSLNFVSQRYHENMMSWCFNSLEQGGKLRIISPDIDYYLKFWLADALKLSPSDFVIKDKQIDKINKELKAENELLIAKAKKLESHKTWYQRVRFYFKSKDAEATSKVNAMLAKAEVPEDYFESIKPSDMLKDLADFENSKEEPWLFDVWLMNKMYGSGAGFPSDTFKSMFNTRYLSVLLRRTPLIINHLGVQSDNPKHIEATLCKHRSRIVTQSQPKIIK